MVNVAVFASGSGTNFENLVKEKANKNYVIKLLIVDKPCLALERAKRLNIECVCLDFKKFADKASYEQEIEKYLLAYDIKIIALAGYMRIISNYLLSRYPNRIINIHPSLLPLFPGKQSIKDVFEAKESQTGVTIHYIDEGIDTGKHIAQESFLIDPTWDLETLEQHVHALEYQMYPKVLDQVCKNYKED